MEILGAPKQLGTIIEGESLLNDGAAIVLFNVLHGEVTGESRNGINHNNHLSSYRYMLSVISGGEIVLYFVRVALGGPVFGWIAGKIVIFWLSHVFNDYLVEIAITLVSTYLTFYIGEEILQVSGVLAVVAMGIEVNTKRTVIEPDVEEFLHRLDKKLAINYVIIIINQLLFLYAIQVLGDSGLHSQYLDFCSSRSHHHSRSILWGHIQ